MTLGEQFHETELRPVRVLILIHEDEGKALAVAVQQVRIVLEELHRLHEQVVEIERVLVLEGPLILRENASHVTQEQIEGTLRVLCERIAVDELVLGVADLGAYRLGAPPLGVEPYRVLNVLHEAKRLVRIEDAERTFPAQPIRVAAEQARADRMKCSHPHARGLRAEQPRDPVSHLAGGFVGERYRQDPVRRHAVLAYQVADTGRQNPRLPRAGTSQHEQRTLEVRRSL